MRELMIAWRDWERIFEREYEGSSFEDKWDAFMRWIDLNTKPGHLST